MSSQKFAIPKIRLFGPFENNWLRLFEDMLFKLTNTTSDAVQCGTKMQCSVLVLVIRAILKGCKMLLLRRRYAWSNAGR